MAEALKERLFLISEERKKKRAKPTKDLCTASQCSYEPTICAVGEPRLCQLPSALWLEDPSSLPPASESWTPPWSSDPAASPCHQAPSSPMWPVSLPAPPGSLVPPATPWSVADHPPPRDSTPLAMPLPSIPPVLSGSSIPLASP
ncbi:hypothetical protein QQF64_027613 [Cirrhinus molitorella]|uniref:Uncharacterized protein n=1 Tax=Cirrhinus molitorella TaxID=172907 RepID=A0ABR3NCY1_9TELE